MARFLGTPNLTREDLEGTAFLIRAERAAKGLPVPTEAESLGLARLDHFRVEVDTARRQSGRRGTKGKGIRVGLAAPTDAGFEGEATHADPTAYDPANVADATDAIIRIRRVLSVAEMRLVMGKAAGFEGEALAERAGVSHAAARKALERARAKLAGALLPGGPLADLGAEGFVVLAPKGGYRHGKGR